MHAELGSPYFGIQKQDKVLSESLVDLSKYPYDALWIICPEETIEVTRHYIDAARGSYIPDSLPVVVVPQRQLRKNVFTGGSFGCIVQAIGQGLTIHEIIESELPCINQARIALICSGGFGVRSTPLNWLSFGNKSLIPNINGKPLLYQILKQILQVNTAPGIWAFGCDILFSLSGPLVYNKNQLSIFVRDISIDDPDAQDYLCLSINNQGKLQKAKYQPVKTELKQFHTITAPMMVTFFPPNCLSVITDLFLSTESSSNLPLVHKYSIELITWFEAMTMSQNDFINNHVNLYGVKDTEKIWHSFQAVQQNIAVRFCRAVYNDSTGILVDIGDINRYMRTAFGTLENPALRDLIGLKVLRINGGIVVKGDDTHLILGKDVLIRGCLVAGGNVVINKGDIQNGIVINHKTDMIIMEGSCLVAGGQSINLSVSTGELIVFTRVQGEMLKITSNRQYANTPKLGSHFNLMPLGTVKGHSCETGEEYTLDHLSSRRSEELI